MHAIIHLALKKYVETRHGQRVWLQLLEEAGHPPALSYSRVGQYPDDEMMKIVDAAARHAGSSVPDVLRDFGAFIAPDLIVMYPRLIRPEWRTLDVLEHTEQTIHQVVRFQNPGARPAILHCVRSKPDEVVVTYTSARRLCALARGIIAGIAEHYGEQVAIDEATCMLRGDAACALVVRLEQA